MLPKSLSSKIWNRKIASKESENIRNKKLRIVFTNGVFDILHAGHVSYLEEAAALGDFLIIGVNSDESVKRLGKSPARPLQSEISRCAVLAALQSVGAVVVFDEDTPKELIGEILPDVLVKGADYKVENIAGADIVLQHGGEVKTITFIPGFSTTAIEQKILSANK
jgi:D-glycero-beta-D-manno-heptose 1-phosphate adenylyltransferase